MGLYFFYHYDILGILLREVKNERIRQREKEKTHY